ncbi:type II secretion system F family protein [Planctomycetota bacterium]
MITYRYVALDYAGKMKEGLTSAASETDVLGWLREQGCTPVSVDMVSSGVKTKWRVPLFQRVRSAELAAVFWQLTTMVDGGITIAEGLEAIAEDIENARLEKILRRMLARIERGGTVSEGMAEFPKVFNKLTCSLIMAGETGGNIGAAFKRVAEFFTNRDKLARKVKKATAYPLFVVGFIIFIVIMIMTLVIPRFRDIFEQIGAGELPAFTRTFMMGYDLIVHNSYYVIGSVLLVIITTVLAYTRIPTVHYMFSALALRLPLFGKLFKQAFVATFCRTMSNLLRGGVPVLEVFDILCEMTSNDVMRAALSRTRSDIVGGASIHLSMAGTKFFPNMVIKMVRAGEDSGSLWKLLDKTADYYEEKVDALISMMTSLLEPILIIIVGIIVLAVVVALYLPIFSLSDIAA